jgi:hypothetical protein
MRRLTFLIGRIGLTGLIGSTLATTGACTSFGSAADGASTSDGGAAGDGGLECPGTHFVCDDFEDDTPNWPHSRWDGVGMAGEANAALSTDAKHSPTHSLMLVANPNGRTTFSKAHLGGFSDLTCSMWLNLDNVPAGGGGFLYLEASNGTGQGYYALFSVFDGVFKFDEGAGGTSKVSAGLGPTSSGWLNVRVELQPGTKLAWSASGSGAEPARPIDGSYASSMGSQAASLVSISVTVGLIRDPTPSSPWRTYIDDVVCDVTP